jgi:hypothetical protein
MACLGGVIIGEYVAVIPMTATFELSTRELNSQVNLQKALDKWVQFHGAKPVYRPPSNDLPCPPAALESDEWLKVKRKRKPFDAPEGFTLWDEKEDGKKGDLTDGRLSTSSEFLLFIRWPSCTHVNSIINMAIDNGLK